MDEIIYSQINQIWSKVKRPPISVVGVWENHVALLLTESVKTGIGIDLFLAYCINE